MSHLLLIVEPVGQRAERTPEQGREAYGAMLRYAESLNERGLLQRAESLKSDAEGVRLRVRDGERSVVDGPFAEAKEMIGGFFLLDCDTREEALALAAECPAAAWATVEVRELGPCFLSRLRPRHECLASLLSSRAPSFSSGNLSRPCQRAATQQAPAGHASGSGRAAPAPPATAQRPCGSATKTCA